MFQFLVFSKHKHNGILLLAWVPSRTSRSRTVRHTVLILSIESNIAEPEVELQMAGVASIEGNTERVGVVGLLHMADA